MHTHRHDAAQAGALSSKLNWLRASVLGGNDGIISMAALLTGVAGAAAGAHALIVTGVAGLLAGASSMAIGEYVSVSSQRDTEKTLLAEERRELEHDAENEFEELAGIYEQKGLRPETARQVARELTAHDAFAAHVDAELGIDPERLTNPWSAGLASAVSYTLGGLIPFLVIVLAPAAARIPATYLAVFVALVLTGLVSARASGGSRAGTVLRVALGGLIAMSITYGIGALLGVSGI